MAEENKGYGRVGGEDEKVAQIARKLIAEYGTPEMADDYRNPLPPDKHRRIR